MAGVRTIAVIGAGTLGRNIAQVAALGGFHTILEDILPGSLRTADAEIRRALDQAVAEGRLEQSATEAALARIEYASSVEQAARAADLIIEAVPDEMESKLEILTLLDKVSRPGTMLACTSSTISVTELASVTYRAEKILGLRFGAFDGAGNELEIVRGQETDDETVTASCDAGRRMGRKVVVMKEARAIPE